MDGYLFVDAALDALGQRMFPMTWGQQRLGPIDLPVAYGRGEIFRYRLTPTLSVKPKVLPISSKILQRALRRFARNYRKVWLTLARPLDRLEIRARKRSLDGASPIEKEGAFSAQARAAFHLGLLIDELPDGRKRKSTILLHKREFEQWLGRLQWPPIAETSDARERPVVRIPPTVLTIIIESARAGAYPPSRDFIRDCLTVAAEAEHVRFSSTEIDVVRSDPRLYELRSKAGGRPNGDAKKAQMEAQKGLIRQIRALISSSKTSG